MSRRDTEARVRTRMWRFRHIATRYVNPVMLRVAGKLPGFGVLTYPGRKSGRTYRTPINVFRRADAYFFFLTYGSDAQWVKNVLPPGPARSKRVVGSSSSSRPSSSPIRSSGPRRL